MLTATIYGLLASAGFLIGGLIGCVASPSRRLVAAVVAFGSGVLVVALTFELMAEAFAQGSAVFTVGGFLLGAVVYVAADLALERLAARSPKRAGRDPGDIKPVAAGIPETAGQAAAGGGALLVGAVLNGVPENVAIGIGLATEGPRLGLVLLGAVFLGNVPEAIGSSVGMRREGRSRTYILAVWGAVAVVCTLATVLGYALLGGLPPRWIGALLALAAGAILAMLADTMMPEAFADGGPLVALATALGFACAFLLTHLV